MVINWTRILGAPRIVVHTQDQALPLVVKHALGENVADVTLERGIRRHDGAAHPHLVVVDLASPHAIETLRAYSQGATPIPTMVIARADELHPRLAAFANGADDVVTMPAAEAEIAARIRALLRRAYGQRLSFVPAVKVGDLEVDVMENRVRCGETAPDLTSTEQAILFVLAKNAGQTVSREAIRRAVWGAADAPPSNIVDRHVRSLRSKLGDSWRAPRYIATVRQHGYRLVAA
ncbi:MAG TPA: response regulator transcription factor [Candidatus Limnocylindria bacterium]|nr:response regulator transcription factor [Candidatus Limnocylindria bacterium]